MNNYRVFVKRHYISVVFYDIEADGAKEARKLAKKAANKEIPDARNIAVDNGWIPDDPTTIPHIGYWASGTFPTVQVIENVHKDTRYEH